MNRDVKRIKFHGTEYWFVTDEIITDGYISPINHFSESGEPRYGFGDISYAIVLGKEIIRFERVIGNINEIQWLDKENNEANHG